MARPRWLGRGAAAPVCIALAAAALLLAACAGGGLIGGPSGWLSAGPNGGGRGNARLALVIGNAAYENATPLANPINDAADMCAALKSLGFRTLCHTNLRTRAEFDARVQEYTDQLDASSVGVFYYSGHGVQAGNANYLIPTQAQPAGVRADPTGVLYGVDDLFERLGQKASRFQFVILDACRTDLFAPPRPAAGAAVAAGRTPLLKSLASVPRAATGLLPIRNAPRSTVVLYATASGDAAFDGDGRNGPLTKHVLRHIGSKGLLFEDFIKKVTRDVETETVKDYRKRQTPFTYGSNTERFCFAGCPGDRTPGPISTN